MVAHSNIFTDELKLLTLYTFSFGGAEGVCKIELKLKERRKGRRKVELKLKGFKCLRVKE